MARGFQLIEWDGRCAAQPDLLNLVLTHPTPPRQPRPILDRQDRVFAVLGGRPRGDNWSTVNPSMQRIFQECKTAYSANSQQTNHRRGDFTAINVGISYGGGQKQVSNLSHSAPNRAVLNSMLQLQPVCRIANFGNSLLQLFAPRMHGHYGSTLNALCAQHSHLNRNFAKSVFCCATFNLGPHTVTKVHTDHLNLPCGWCSITALGDFDEKQGGHLVLWDLRMLIEFPAGSTILIPSAILRHSNTPVQPHERQYSLTQFSPGGVFRWVACGFQSAKDAGVTSRDLNREGRGRWELGLSMFSTWTELVKAHT
ncbi:hypothetical protein C8Q73DRAFT_652558 [Cubamyces lactineus]|nr:hypothetical protein C8Q73DRAFT_660258 [Cubamyces lactineus]KAH9890401.1 hypothetical protein C8Q73DRAFT_652558 [Cubamyces lactineus]